MIVLGTRKPVDKLKVRDFEVFPIWEFAIDEEDVPGRDETWVRPVNGKVILRGEYSLLVATEFHTPSQREFRGFMIVTTAHGDVEIERGVVVGRFGYKPVPSFSRKLAVRKKCEWDLKARDKLVEATGLSESEVFPLKFTLRILVRGEKTFRSGVLR